MITPTSILIVEDNEDDSFLLVRQLQKAHIDDHVTVVRDGLEALEFLKAAETLPLAVFLDLRLPGLNGVELLEKIRSDSRLRELPVMIMTGSNDPRDLEECQQLGVTAYLSKPIRLTTFIKTITDLFPRTEVAG